MLDFSSAFDRIDHPILAHRLHTDIGFTDTVLQWFSSYLTDRTHYVSLSNHCSAFASVHSGVSRGSVLGSILFFMYTKPLSAVIDSHSIIHNSFVNDLQLPMSAPSEKTSKLLHYMQSYKSDDKAWATENMLKPNDNKTELMLVTSKIIIIIMVIYKCYFSGEHIAPSSKKQQRCEHGIRKNQQIKSTVHDAN